jgi:hypothetical protein
VLADGVNIGLKPKQGKVVPETQKYCILGLKLVEYGESLQAVEFALSYPFAG